MKTKTKALLALFGGAVIFAGAFVGSLVLFISPRLIGSIGIIDVDGEKSMGITLDSEKDYDRLKKYSYVVLRSNEYVSHE